MAHPHPGILHFESFHARVDNTGAAHDGAALRAHRVLLCATVLLQQLRPLQPVLVSALLLATIRAGGILT